MKSPGQEDSGTVGTSRYPDQRIRAINDWASRCVPDPELMATLGISISMASKLAFCALVNGTDVSDEILTEGQVSEDRYYRALAGNLGLRYVPDLSGFEIFATEESACSMLSSRFGTRIAFLRSGLETNLLALAPRTVNKNRLARFLEDHPGISDRICIVPPSRIRQAFLNRGQAKIIETAKDGLATNSPEISAKTVVNAWQGFTVGSCLIGIPIAWIYYPVACTLAAHAFFSVFFLACVYLRISAASGNIALDVEPVSEQDLSEFPVYSVLVPLYHEADIVPELLAALGRIIWPRSKLEIKIICEADDLETIAAVRDHRPKPWMEIVRVPACQPRTKPKALNFAAQLCSGEFVTIFDAEDNPHPFQLIEAWHRFRTSPADLACVQAPLDISNYRQPHLSRMFAVEYAALFRGLLPWLADRGYVLPLGGTSNHFRREALENVGWWDPYNVTEDADLGLRLFRHGYRISTISRPTVEQAPTIFGVWLKQRSRWYKGWIQTWLVHNRSPRLLLNDLGLSSFLIAQVLFSGLVISALAHPIILYTLFDIFMKLTSGQALGRFEFTLLLIDTTNIIFGYGAFLLLAFKSMHTDARRSFWSVVATTPLYWLAMSLAAWHAVADLIRKPHYWAKTPHTARKATG